MSSDRTLADAFAALEGQAYRLALWILRDPAEAEDAVQEGCLRAWNARAQTREEANLRPWLLRIVANAARDRRRADERRRAREDAVARRDSQVDAPRPVDAMVRAETVAFVRDAVDRLEDRLRLPLLLHHVEGLPHKEVAAVLGMPIETTRRHASRGAERVREGLARAGFAAAAPTLMAALRAGLWAEAPAGLAGKTAALAAGGAMGKLGGTAAVATAAKGGIAMKAVASIVVAGTVAGAVAVSTGFGRAPAPLPSAGDGEPVAVNPYGGTQDREEVFEFAQKPKIAKKGDGYVISFAPKGKCDATVAIIDKDGKIVRHLASGVLGKNAPHPFQQNTLSQKIEWDGTNDQGEKAPAGCKVRVSLGLKPVFDRNIGYDPYDLPTGRSSCQLPEARDNTNHVVGKGVDGEVYVLGLVSKGGFQGRVYGKDGKYVRTFWPPSAKDVEKLAQFKSGKRGGDYTFAETTWGDKILVTDRYGPGGYKSDGRKVPLPEHGKAMFFAAGVTGYKMEPKPANIPAPTLGWDSMKFYGGHFHRMAADREREQLYITHPRMGMVRLDGKTGEIDKTWFPAGDLTKVTETHMGPDGMLYVRIGTFGYGQWIVRFDRTGKIVDFGGDAVVYPMDGKWPDTGEGIYGGYPRPKAFGKQPIKALWTGLRNHSNVHERGLYVSPKGYILAAVQFPDAKWAAAHGSFPKDAPQKNNRFMMSYVGVWDKNGKLLTSNAIGDMCNGHGVAMDADGNIYAAMGGRWPAAQTSYDGLVNQKGSQGNWGSYGSLLKFQGGKPFPRGAASYGKGGEGAPASAAKLYGYRSGPTAIDGPLWIWGGLTCQTPDICTCHNTRYDMDYFARHWIPANQLFSVMVVDANGNRIARLGRYGNVDDTEADMAEDGEGDGLHFVWPRAVAVSDTALYVADIGSKRILRAKIEYHAEETVGLDGTTSTSAPPPPAPAPTPTGGPAATPAAEAASPPPPARTEPTPEEACRGWWSLAMSYKRAGRQDKAREYLQKIIETYPESDYAGRAKREIAGL